ncbi:diacylglycerol acyltransferase type 2B [Cladochytrium replicatum]|nr:diacylglycerol acyltransferase type 2B [Cladochytrium replicatum]
MSPSLNPLLVTMAGITPFINIAITIVGTLICISFRSLWLPFWLYCSWLYLDKAPWRGGRKNAFIRKNIYLIRELAAYFPVSLHSDTDEITPSNGPYIFCFAPHGIWALGSFTNFTTDVTGFPDLFPGIDLFFSTVNINFFLPFSRDAMLGRGFIAASKDSIDYVLGLGKEKAVGIVLGGATESLESYPGTNRVILNRRKGFVKLALRRNAKLVPVYSFGETNTYYQLRLPAARGIQRWVQDLLGFTVPLFYGRWWIFPRRVPINTVVGKPIALPKIQGGEPTQEEIEEGHKMYVEGLKELYNKYKDIYDKGRTSDLEIL